MSTEPYEGLVTNIVLTRLLINDKKINITAYIPLPLHLQPFFHSPLNLLAPNKVVPGSLKFTKENSNFYKVSNTSLKVIRTFVFLLIMFTVSSASHFVY